MPITEQLAGRSAIVTGGGSGIGQAIARRFAEQGARIAILDLAADQTVQQIIDAGGSAMHLQCDVASAEAVNAAFDTAAREHGPIDILVNSAGIAHVANIERTSEEDFDRLYAVNVKG